MAFLQKGCYKWQPNKSLGLDVVNLIIFISKNGEKKLLNHKFFPLEKKKKKPEKKKICQVGKSHHKEKHWSQWKNYIVFFLQMSWHRNLLQQFKNAIRVLKMNKNDIQICKHYRVFRFILEYSSLRSIFYMRIFERRYFGLC